MSVIPDPALNDWVPIYSQGPQMSQYSTRVYRSTPQSVGAAWAFMSFDSVRWDKGGMWNASNPTRLTCQYAGTYAIWGMVQLAAATAAVGSYRMCGIRLNGTQFISEGGPVGFQAVASNAPHAAAFTLHDLAVGDYVELSYGQDSGANVNTETSDATKRYGVEFAMALVGGPQGPAGVGVPQPIVNGQWIKGVGGAAVWSAIADVDVPSISSPGTARLSPRANQSFTDWNNATQNGWWTSSTAANSPLGDSTWWLGRVDTHDYGSGNQWITQELWNFTAGSNAQESRYRRRCNAPNTWGPWIRIDNPKQQLGYWEYLSEVAVGTGWVNIFAQTVNFPVPMTVIQRFFCAAYDTNNTGAVMTIRIQSETESFDAEVPLTNSGVRFGSINLSKRYPSYAAGNHTFYIYAIVNNGNAWLKTYDTTSVQGGARHPPMYMEIERVGN
jgi:hypothetical protein